MSRDFISAFNEKLAKYKIDAYYISISNENLYEFVRYEDNYIIDLTNFSGDTGSLLITKNKWYLYVDGRFTIQAKNEVKNKKIKIVEVSKSSEKIDDLLKRIGDNKTLSLNPKLTKSSFLKEIIEKAKINKIKIKFDEKFLNGVKENVNLISDSKLFHLDKKYVSENSKTKITKLIKEIKKVKNVKSDVYYVTSNLEEISYLTNLKNKPSDVNKSVLFDSFFIASTKKSVLYIKDNLDSNATKYIKKSNIIIKNYDEFYNDIIKIKKIKNESQYYLDDRINNYYIYNILKDKNETNIIKSPLNLHMSLKGDIEIKNLRKCNILDGVAMAKILYKIKSDYKANKLKYNTEYKIKQLVDETRKSVGLKNYLCESFETIVAYKSNSAICHYIPSKTKSRKIIGEGLLLIDSGGNYLSGTTDITRTISLYKNKIPEIVKKHYNLVLESLIKLSILKFPYGLTGYEIDIVAREKMYNEFLDFNHGTGHGIGYVSNVHEGPNRIGPFINKNFNENVLEEHQLTSNEPGLYFENKYGIRLENDILTIPIKANIYGLFLGFETMTLCPFDRDLIDKKYLSKESIIFLNKYHNLVYKKLHKYLTYDERDWLKKETREV